MALPPATYSLPLALVAKIDGKDVEVGTTHIDVPIFYSAEPGGRDVKVYFDPDVIRSLLGAAIEPLHQQAVRAAVEGHFHKPVAHADRRPPWCDDCGLTADHLEPTRAKDWD